MLEGAVQAVTPAEVDLGEKLMQLRFAALVAATALVGLSVLFASEPVSSGGSDVAAAKTFVVVEPTADDCPWKTTDPAA
jgi:hypothetical protein